MRVQRGMLRSGNEGYKVINISTGKTVYSSFSRIDCEQYIFAKEMMKCQHQ